MVAIYIAIIMSVAAIMMWVFSDSHNKKVFLPVAFAGSPEADVETIQELSIPKYEVELPIDQSVLERCDAQFLIKGRSLEKLGICDGAHVFVKTSFCLNEIEDRFIILQIDNQRTIKEYPDAVHQFNGTGTKARKALKLVENGLSDAELHQEIEEFLDKHSEDWCKDESERSRIQNEITEKYRFASNYYAEDDKLIFSVTYRKDGQQLGFSFHSLRYLIGIVEFSTIPN